MLTEEWRLHVRLFGGRRFALFPVFVLAISLGGYALLFETGAGRSAVVAGLHALVAFFGLQVGTIGLVGRDAMRNVLGDVTLLVFTSRTLPLSGRRLLGVFLLKDLLFYSAFFLAPIALAYTPFALSGDGEPAMLALLWVTLTGSFTLGVAASLTLVGLASRHRLIPPVIVAAVTVAVVAGGVDPLRLTPYAVYTDPGLAALALGFGPTMALSIAGPLLFQPVESSSGRHRLIPARRIAALLPDRYGLAERALLDVARSSGSVWKVVFSMGVLFAVAGVLVVELAAATTLDPSTGIAFGTLLGLGGFTTYAWLTTFDDTDEYRRLPVTLGDVLAGKRTAYLTLLAPIGTAYLALAALWFPVGDLAIGLVIFPPVSLYVFGLTAYVAGLSPTELLFDTALFALFGVAMAAVAVPLLVAALAHGRYPLETTALAVAIAGVSAVVGGLLSRRAGPRWDERLRA
jgi:hypothetical protein